MNEAVDQLAEAYLERKQAETKRRIPHDDYAMELQKTRMFIADRNVFGVDMNPVATELAEVRLWLNAIYGEAGKRAKSPAGPCSLVWLPVVYRQQSGWCAPRGLSGLRSQAGSKAALV